MGDEMSRGTVIRNTFWELGAGLLSTVANLATFVILGRAFGDDGYGVLSGTMAAMLLVGPFSALGAGHLIVRAVNEGGRRPRLAFRKYVLLAPIGGLAVLAIVLLTRTAFLPQSPLGLFITIAIAELIAQPLLSVISQASQAIEDLRVSAVSLLTSRILRLFGAIVFVFVLGEDTPELWGFVHLGAVVIGVLVGLAMLSKSIGGLPKPTRPSVGDAREGFPFGISAGSLFIKNEADKYLLLRNGFEEQTGHYTAAYRLLTAAQVPVLALVNATYARFFDRGKDGGASTRLALRLTAVGELYAVAVAVGMVLFAPILPSLLGDEYTDAVNAVRSLAIVPLLLVAQLFAGQSLTGTGRNSIRVSMSVMAAVGNIVLNLILIPSFDIVGAIASTIATEAFLAIGLWVALVRTKPITAPEVPAHLG